jgi:hypothetical protein
VELGVRGAVLRASRRLRPLTTLRFEVPTANGAMLELYAKVVEVREGSDELYSVRFTAVSASLEGRLRDLLAARAARD